MAFLEIPGGPRLKWGDRRRSRVRVWCRYPWRFWTGEEPATEAQLDAELNLPRAAFDDSAALLDLLLQLGLAFVTAAKQRRRVHGRHVTVACSLPIAGKPKATLTLRRAALPLLQREDGKKLGAGLCARCFTSFVVPIVKTTPRGKSSLTSRRLTLLLPAALLGACTLVASRHTDERLQARIKEIIEEDAELAVCLWDAERLGRNLDQALAVGLVDRALRGAWEAAGRPGLIYRAAPESALYRAIGETPPPAVRYRDPSDVFREYTYGQHTKALIEHILRMKPPYRKILQESWARTYLGEPGAAAREFRLIL
jgi:hypothetical protein